MGICLVTSYYAWYVSLAILSCLNMTRCCASRRTSFELASNTSQSALEAMASRIFYGLWLPFRIGLIEVYTSCSVGIALSPEHGSDSTRSFVTPTQQCTQRRKADEDNFAFLPQK